MKKKIKSCSVYGLKILGIIFGSVLLGTVILATVYNIPTKQWTEGSMKASAETLAAEGVYPEITKRATSRLDNYTDSIMLLTAVRSGSESVFVQAMEADRDYIKNQEPLDVVVEHYKNGEEFDSLEEYSRYWHGYLIFLKPLLSVFSYKEIRIINTVIQVGLIAITVFMMVKRKKKYLIAPLLILWGFLMPLALMKSLQFSSCFYVMMIGILSLVSMKKITTQKMGFLFAGLGILVAFFDLLTYPLITFGVPMTVYFLIKNEQNSKKRASEFALAGGSWLIGYIGMWVGKWTIGSIILGKELFTEAIDQLLLRTSTVDEQYQKIDILNNNFGSFFHTPITTVFLIYSAVMITLIVIYTINQKRKNKNWVKNLLKTVWPFLGIAVLPILWFLIISNHSYHHYWFTNKICGVVVFAWMCGLVRLYLNARKEAKLR